MNLKGTGRLSTPAERNKLARHIKAKIKAFNKRIKRNL